MRTKQTTDVEFDYLQKKGFAWGNNLSKQSAGSLLPAVYSGYWGKLAGMWLPLWC